jgi:small-conductance mechanosensitive channel
LGLQRIASNFISGFILVLDRSVKPGDLITVGENFGRVEQLNSRYVVLRNRQGVDSLIPNEHLIINEVTNWSYADPNVRLDIDVQVSYNDDPEHAMALMLECAFASPRVLKEPEPSIRMLNFADNGIHLQLRVWIGDLENGRGAVKSDINRAIWHQFKKHGISFPYPQRDLHLKTGWPPAAASSAPQRSED